MIISYPLWLVVIIAQKIAIYTHTDTGSYSVRPFSHSLSQSVISVSWTVKSVSLQKTQSLVSQLAQSAASTAALRATIAAAAWSTAAAVAGIHRHYTS